MINSITRKYHSWKKYRETYDELARLSNRELHDLGIGRSDIEFVARKTAR
ncbi:DUF1127 domain-containing protein [Breoghania sp. L-A4]|nr:DUF1127 domain-containing protein [Breoghania sp. L-A4]AXS40547.1 DUF1127 domain-containing protein [Breoghania sp. L-A4]